MLSLCVRYFPVYYYSAWLVLYSDILVVCVKSSPSCWDVRMFVVKIFYKIKDKTCNANRLRDYYTLLTRTGLV